ncbi:MAG: class I poly(R)-hydroxyalkanoic acid synthase, partial [Burkholderiaceae bacterium]|nr:class I poly(R)-hydroxyalkanoic acid synthase [Burkholderiaceae bacterium]
MGASGAAGTEAQAAIPTLPSLALSPARLLELQQSYVERMNALWRDFLTAPQKLSEPLPDPRFADEAWQQNSLASLYARAYLLNAEFMNKLADSVEADRKTKRRIKFAVQQWVEAAAPSNFLALNPRAQKRLLETKGESLTAGVANLLKDLARGKISQTDESAFEVG